MRAVAWVAAAALAVAVVTSVVLAGIHDTGDDPLTTESMREIEAAVREGREWSPDDDQPWVVRNPVPTGVGAGVLTAIIGLLVVIAVSTGQRGSPRS